MLLEYASPHFLALNLEQSLSGHVISMDAKTGPCNGTHCVTIIYTIILYNKNLFYIKVLTSEGPSTLDATIPRDYLASSDGDLLFILN